MKVNEVAIWFLNKDKSLCNGYIDENTRLNKLLYFSSLLYFSKFGKELLDEKFERWDRGPVLKSLYKDYRYNRLGEQKFKTSKIENKEIERILNIINLIYADKTASELSEETHTHNIWLETSKNSKMEFKNISESLRKQMLNYYKLYENFDFDNIKVEKINGNKFYYDKRNLKMTEKLLKELEMLEKMPYPQFIELIDGEVVFS